MSIRKIKARARSRMSQRIARNPWPFNKRSTYRAGDGLLDWPDGAAAEDVNNWLKERGYGF